ncbi:MAG: hypothetical protein WKG07_37970 [Hymenobacter sp.]
MAHCPPASGRRLTDAQVLTTALVAARFFGGNLVLWPSTTWRSIGARTG